MTGQCLNVETVSTLVKNVTSNGIISVARNTTKRMRRNGNSRNANAYAAHTDVTIWPATIRNVTRKLLNRYLLRCPSDHAVAYTFHCGCVGNSVGGRWPITSGRSSEFTT